MSASSCPQCGARFDEPAPACADRFAALLALDHSRQEPWGSRHGLAFAAYTLQHPEGQTADALDRCWTMLCRVYLAGDDRLRVAGALRGLGSRKSEGWAVPLRPEEREKSRGFRITIADLGAFDAAGYPELLDAWCRSTLAGWGLDRTP